MHMPTRVGLAGLTAVAVTYGFARYGYGLFVPALREEFGLSTQSVGVLASASYVAYLVALVGTGVITARMGPRAPVVIGALSAAAGMGLVAFATSAPVLVVGIVLAGSSAGWSWAPFSDAVARMVETDAQPRTLSVISTGTTFGLMVAAPIALVAGAAWRPAWLAFTVVALAAAAYNAWLLPSGNAARHAGLPRLRLGWFVCPRSGPLLLFGLIALMAGSIYLTYAVDLMRAGGMPVSAGPVLWLLIGVAGVGAVVTGDLVGRYGLPRMLATTLITLAAAIAVLGAAPGSWSALAVSAALFGASYMIAAALLVVWSARVFQERPATGFTAAILTGSVGSIAGPAAAGLLAAHIGLASTFMTLAAITVAAVSIRPAAVDRRAGASPAAHSAVR